MERREKPQGAHGKIRQVDVGRLAPCPWQPRRQFDEAELRGLAASIAENGVLQPLLVRRMNDGTLQLIAGERRLRAARLAGLTRVPCVELDADDEAAAMLSLLENLQRQDLHFFEEAQAIASLIEDWELSQEEAAARLGKSQSALANKLRLLRLPPATRERIRRAGLTERHARALLRLEDAAQRDRVLDEVIRRRLRVSETERLVELCLAPKTVRRQQSRTSVVRDIRLFVNTLTHAVDVMRSSGIPAEARQDETEQYVEYVVRIPKPDGTAAVAAFGARGTRAG